MKKRILSMLLVLLMVVTLVPIAALADGNVVAYEVTGGKIYFDKSTGAITNSDAKVKVVDIPSKIDGVLVTSIGDKAFYCRTSLTNVTIPDSVNKIGNEAFGGCSLIKSLNIQGNVSVGDQAFFLCRGLKSITISGFAESIGEYAFSYCRSLNECKILNGVKTIKACAFYECSGLTSVDIPNSITRIETMAFSGCKSLEQIDIPNNVSYIGGAVFEKCASLKNITIPDGIKIIPQSTFDGCTNLINVNIPESVEGIGNYAFRNCRNIISINLPSNLLLLYGGAFQGCTKLETINIPKSLKEIGASAFYACSSLKSIYLSKNIKTIGDYAFSGCDSIKDVYYSGNETQWSTINIGTDNECLKNSSIHYGEYPPHTHKYVETVTKPTCTEKGYTTYTCSVCGDSYKGSYTDALGHSYVNGSCTRCGAKDPNYKPTVSFADVPSDAFYANAVKWAVENGITTGVGNNRFDPNGQCTRGQVVTFLWRAAGKPTVSANVSFSDVQPGAFYYEAVKWAVANGITTGVGGNRFAPNDSCTRGQVVTFLHRAENSPAASTISSFTDVPSTAFYYNAVKWAVENGITSGVGNNRFAPNDTCTRAQVVTFLYRAQ